MALRRHHLGDGPGHWPCAALCSAADERPAERLLRHVPGHGEHVVIGFWTPDSVLPVDDWQGHVPEFACHKLQSGQANQASLVETQCKLSRSFLPRRLSS